VIGLPSDSIEVKNDVLYINGIADKEPYLTPFPKEVSHLWQTVIGMLLSISNRKDYAY
jgi:hypothetical protein